MRCGCRRNGNTCGPGCRCQGCTNLLVANYQELHRGNAEYMDSDEEASSNTDESEQSGDEETGMEEEIVTEEFDHLLVNLPDIT